MEGLKWLPVWKMVSTAARGNMGRVIEKHWNGKQTYGDGDFINESFRLLVQRFDTQLGIVFVPPSLYVKIEIGEDIELDPDFAA